MKKETKEERFKRVAEKRVQNLIRSIRSLSQLANSKVYQWRDNQLGKIWAVVENEISRCKKTFEEPDSDIFKL